jgi:hypothetical protein
VCWLQSDKDQQLISFFLPSTSFLTFAHTNRPPIRSGPQAKEQGSASQKKKAIRQAAKEIDSLIYSYIIHPTNVKLGSRFSSQLSLLIDSV